MLIFFFGFWLQSNEERNMMLLKPANNQDLIQVKKLDVVQLCETQMFKFVLCEAVNINSFSAS